MPTVKITEKNKNSRPAHPSRAADYMKRYYAASFRFWLNAPFRKLWRHFVFICTTANYSVMANAAKRRKSKDNYMKCVLAAPRFYYDGVFHNILLRISLICWQIYSVYIIS